MREFYRLETIDSSVRPFAYCYLPEGSKYADTCPECPKCGKAMGWLDWLEPRRVVLSKPKYGDFVPGLRYLVSENFKLAYEQSDLKGIKAFIPVEIAKIGYFKPTSPLPPQYYVMDLERSFARIDIEKSSIEGTPQEEWQYCSLCNPFRVTRSIITGLYIDDTNWGGEDIFHLHDMGGSVYASQKFIDFCEEKKFTNFRYTNTKEYTSGHYK